MSALQLMEPTENKEDPTENKEEKYDEDVEESDDDHPCDVAARKTLFIQRCARGQMKDVRETYKKVTPETRAEGYSAACRQNRVDLVRFFLWNTDIYPWFALQFPYVCRRGWIRMVEVMLEFMHDDDQLCDLGLQEVCCDETPAHFEIVRLLKKKKTTVLDFGRGYCTAAKYSKRKMADLMLANGALESFKQDYRNGKEEWINRTYNCVRKTNWKVHNDIFRDAFQDLFRDAFQEEVKMESQKKQKREVEKETEEVENGKKQKRKVENEAEEVKKGKKQKRELEKGAQKKQKRGC